MSQLPYYPKVDVVDNTFTYGDFQMPAFTKNAQLGYTQEKVDKALARIEPAEVELRITGILRHRDLPQDREIEYHLWSQNKGLEYVHTMNLLAWRHAPTEAAFSVLSSMIRLAVRYSLCAS